MRKRTTATLLALLVLHNSAYVGVAAEDQQDERQGALRKFFSTPLLRVPVPQPEEEGHADKATTASFVPPDLIGYMPQATPPPPAAPASSPQVPVPIPAPPIPPEILEAEARATKQQLYRKDMQRGGIFDMPDGDLPDKSLPGATVTDKAQATTTTSPPPPHTTDTSMHGHDDTPHNLEDTHDLLRPTIMRAGGGGRPGLAVQSVVAAAAAVAHQGVAAAERKHGVGAGAIASPAVLNMPHPVLGMARAVFVGFKRIGAMNVDFNLPISPYDRFGSAIAVLLPFGDLDHDATSVELVVGAPGDRTYQKKQGAVYILSLANFGTMLRNYHKIIPGEGALAGQACKYAGFGSAVASLGDLDGDGYADIAVGSPFQEETGVVYILFLTYGGVVAKYTKLGGVDKLGGAMWGNPYYGNPTYPAPLEIGDEFGCSLANIGDLDGDGVPDLAVGACGDPDVKKGWLGDHDSCFAAGAVYILFMNVDGTVKYHRKISARSGNLLVGPQPGDRFGASIALLGDINGNGYPEIAVGAPFADASGHEVGAVYVLELLPSGDVKRFEILSTAYAAPTGNPHSQYWYLSAPLAPHDYLGSAVAAADVDRDGHLDMLVGARGFNQRAQDEGGAFVCYLDGGPALTGWEQAASQSGLLVPVQPGEQFGAALAVLDDPGRAPAFSLLFVGAPGECNDASGGSVYVLRVQPVVG